MLGLYEPTGQSALMVSLEWLSRLLLVLGILCYFVGHAFLWLLTRVI